MNEIEKGQLCKTTVQCFMSADGYLANFPGLLKKIILGKVWESRMHNGRLIELPSLRALITEKPINGWGQDPKKIEAVIKDDAEVLAMFREAMKEQGKRNDLCSNPTEVEPTDRGKAYTLSRLKRESPELFADVCAGKLSANAAAIKAGFRKVKSHLDNLRLVWAKASPQERKTFIAECVNEEANDSLSAKKAGKVNKEAILANLTTPFQFREIAGLARVTAKMKTMRLAKVKIHGAENVPDYDQYPTLEEMDRHCRVKFGKSLAEMEEAGQ